MRVLFWFRGDPRLEDNTGLAEAARDARGDMVPFHLLAPAARDTAPVRQRFERESIATLAAAIERAGSRLVLREGPAAAEVPRAAREARADAVYWNEEIEPDRTRRDDEVERALRRAGIRVRRFHDRLLVPPGAVTTAGGTPFRVFTAFRHACERLPLAAPLPRVTRFARHELAGIAPGPRAAHEPRAAAPWRGGAVAARQRLRRFLAGRLARYAALRDVPAADATSRLSPDLAAGTLSPRTVAHEVRRAAEDDPRLAAGARKLVEELRWRDFFAHVLVAFPHVANGAFRREYDDLAWSGDPAHFAAWQAGRTGFPFVDAGLRELAASGFLPNRVRMVAASFLVKDLLLDWRLGERHFLRTLLDGDLASNNGNWQWAASTGTDAQPFFRVFHPVLQGRRYDADGAYVRRWVPELARLPARWIHRPWEAPAVALAEARIALGRDYPRPLVDHEEQRERAIEMFRRIRK